MLHRLCILELVCGSSLWVCVHAMRRLNRKCVKTNLIGQSANQASLVSVSLVVFLQSSCLEQKKLKKICTYILCKFYVHLFEKTLNYIFVVCIECIVVCLMNHTHNEANKCFRSALALTHSHTLCLFHCSKPPIQKCKVTCNLYNFITKYFFTLN